MIDPQRVKAQHADCNNRNGCIISYKSAWPTKEDHTIKHQKCKLTIKGFQLAIDCDKCASFATTQGKLPDLLILRELNGRSEWLIVEIKMHMRLEARDQVKAGLDTLRHHRLLEDFKADTVQGLLAFICGNNVHTSDLDRLRKPLRLNGRVIAVRDHRCGSSSI